MKYEDITIIRDTREKDGHGWIFEADEKKSGPPRIAKTVVKMIDAGDYSVEGLEHLIRIERKQGFTEVIGNFLEKDRFEREMEKLKAIKYKYIFIETVMSKDLLGLSIQQFRFPIPIKSVNSWLTEIELKYGVITRYVGDAGHILAKQLLKLVAKEHFQNLYDLKLKAEGNE